jgi:hypothetical protein
MEKIYKQPIIFQQDPLETEEAWFPQEVIAQRKAEESAPVLHKYVAAGPQKENVGDLLKN